MNRYYKERFNKVLEYIHLNLDSKLDMKTLSEVAFISEYHFHRLIKSFLGEALGTYIKRIRVETGAKLLKYSDCSITDIAYKIGYETPTSFNKSFKNQFGVSPTHFRKTPNHSFAIVKRKKKNTNFDLLVENETIQPILILTNQSKGLIGSIETNDIWNELMSFATQNSLFTPKTKMYGINWDDPSITQKQNLRYDACISINQVIKTAQFTVKRIEGGKYLCFTYKGDYQYIGDIYDQIFREYILTKNILLREEPLFDQYLNDKNETADKDLLTKIFIPIQ